MKIVDTSKWIYKHSKPFIPKLIMLVSIGIITSILGVLSAIASKKLIDYAIDADKEQAIRALIVFLVIILIQIIAMAILSSQTARASETYSNRLRLNLYERLTKSSWGDFTKYHSDDILTRLTSDVHVVTSGIIETIPNIIMLGLQLLIAFLTLFYYDRVLAFLAIILGPVFILFYRLFRVKLKDLHLKTQKAEGLYRAYLHECVQNISILKVFSAEKNSSKNLNRLQEDRIFWVMKKNKVNVIASSILSLGYHIGFLLSFAWGAYRLSKGFITFGTMTVFFQLVSQIQGPFVTIARSIPQLIATEGSATRLMEMEKIQQEEDKEHNININKAGIEFENLAFRYNEEKQVLKNVSATIKPGEIVSIIGPSGEGKTTLVRLVLSLLEQNYGMIKIVSEDQHFETSPSTRDIISYVPQGNTLFSGTILDNLKIGKPDATEEEIFQALKDASAYDFVCKLKDGLNTVIGERGIGLSEGQAQRIAIARALIRKAPILILDEATSALDEDTELNVLNAIRNMQPRPTCLLITHRPTVYNLTDRVLRLKDGFFMEKNDLTA